MFLPVFLSAASSVPTPSWAAVTPNREVEICGSSRFFADEVKKNVFESLLAGLLAQFFQRSNGGDFSSVDNGDSVAEGFHFRHDMRGKNHRPPGVPAAANEARNSSRRKDVEAVGGFVEEKHGRTVQNRPGNGNALFLPGRKFVAAGISEGINVKFRENFFDARMDFRAGKAVEFAEIGDHFPRRHAFIQRGRAGEKADIAADFLALPRNIEALNPAPRRKWAEVLWQASEAWWFFPAPFGPSSPNISPG